MLGIILVEIFVLEIFLPVTQPLTFPKTLKQECFIFITFICEGYSFYVNSHTYQTGQKNILSLFWILDLAGKPQSAYSVLDLAPEETNVREDKLRPFLNCTVSLLSEHILNFSNLQRVNFDNL